MRRAETKVEKRGRCKIGELRDHSRNHLACRRVRDRHLHTVDNRGSSRGYRGCLVDLGFSGARGRWSKALLVARQSLAIHVVCGDDVDEHVQAVRTYLEADLGEAQPAVMSALRVLQPD